MLSQQDFLLRCSSQKVSHVHIPLLTPLGLSTNDEYRASYFLHNTDLRRALAFRIRVNNRNSIKIVDKNGSHGIIPPNEFKTISSITMQFEPG